MENNVLFQRRQDAMNRVSRHTGYLILRRRTSEERCIAYQTMQDDCISVD